MFHFRARAVPGTLLFRTWAEALLLWAAIVARVPVRALTLMPDHVHAELSTELDYPGMCAALRAFALSRNRVRGESGPVFRETSELSPLHTQAIARRTRRYIHLNPCRKGLVTDPLAWPFSTHRDTVGFVLNPVCPRAVSAERFHRYVSGDPSVDRIGTPLPVRRDLAERPASLREIQAAVSALTRTPESALRRRGPARDLLLAAARALGKASAEEIAHALGVHPATVRRHPARPDERVALVARVVGDPRFTLLHDGDLREERSWSAYRHLR